MEKTVIKLVILKSKNKNFTKIKYPTSIKNVDINKVVVSNRVSFGKKKRFKYFIGYKDDKIRTLCIFLPKMSTYRRDFDETK